MNKYRCEICGKAAKYKQFCPDYSKPFLFCSIIHYRKYRINNLYRSLPLQDIKTEEFVEKFSDIEKIKFVPREKIVNMLKVLRKLSYRYKFIFIERFLEDKTLVEIGNKMNLTKERIRQMEHWIINKIYIGINSE
jgi:RNA polymerase sigma factor (sigma-70 family)